MQEAKMTFLGRIASAAAVGVGALIAAGVSTPPAQAAFVLTLEQEGPNVVATGSGTLDPTDLGFDGFEFSGSFLVPSDSEIFTGAAGEFILYAGTHGPSNFGTGDLTFASSGSGDLVTLGFNTIGVPQLYVSGSALSDSATYDNATFASLGIRPGVYVWTWGSGADADSFTLRVVAAPESSTWAMMLLGFAGLGYAGYRQRQKLSRAASA
jgi:hypothetical protein